jgi:hypothetical protein
MSDSMFLMMFWFAPMILSACSVAFVCLVFESKIAVSSIWWSVLILTLTCSWSFAFAVGHGVGFLPLPSVLCIFFDIPESWIFAMYAVHFIFTLFFSSWIVGKLRARAKFSRN